MGPKHRVNRAALKRLDDLLAGRKKMPRLATLAAFIQAEIPELKVSLEEGHCNTDRKPEGFRYITRPGKGRKGTRIKVRNPDGTFLIDHNSAETYRSNDEVVTWIRMRLEGNPWAWRSWGIPTATPKTPKGKKT